MPFCGLTLICPFLCYQFANQQPESDQSNLLRNFAEEEAVVMAHELEVSFFAPSSNQLIVFNLAS